MLVRPNASTLFLLCAMSLASPRARCRAATVLPPQNLLVLPQSETDSSMVLLWDKPADYANITGYEVYQNGTMVATTAKNSTFYGVANLTPITAYSFSVVAKDGSDNRSAPSVAVTASTRPLSVVIDVSSPLYGAKGDGTTMNTAAIQRAINDCPGGGTVRIPAGTFLTGPIVLKSDMSLYVAKGGILKGSTDAKDYLPMIWTRYMGVECDCFQPLIRIGTMDHKAGYTTKNVTVCGEGEIRGGGETLGLQEAYDQRSRLILIQNAQNVALMGLHLTYPAGWTIHPLYSDNITTWNVWVESWDAPKGHSGDGFDPDSCTNCYLVDSTLHTWDNSFSPKSGRGLEGYQIGRPCKHIIAVGCIFRRGAPSIGSEVSGGIEDVVVRDSTIDGTYFYVKTSDSRGAYIRNFVIKDVDFTRNNARSIRIDTNCPYRNRPPKAPSYTICSDFLFQNLTGCGDIIIDGSFGLPHGPPRGSYVQHVTFSNVQLTNGRNVSLQYCDGVQFDHVRCADGSEPAYALAGTNDDISKDHQPLLGDGGHRPPDGAFR
jgi:polygalacturonase